MTFPDHTPNANAMTDSPVSSSSEKAGGHPFLLALRSALRFLALKPSAARVKRHLRIIRRLEARRRKKALSLVKEKE